MSSSLAATKATAGKRAKRHDRDKYYRLAKEQGYRSRAAFKLLQINKKYKFLSKAKTVIDLCAAPGGWTQVARNSLPSTGTVIALDILPIRPIPNVITHVADITTGKGQSLIRQSMSGSLADVVLCDGAPNVGGAFEKDSYLQNEIVLHSLKCACQHLMQNGTFVTKVYRSADYTSLIWVLKQLFGDVEAVKPASSRQQSAEIFLVCLGFKKPKVLDERFFQPKHVFSQISSDKKAISVFDKDYTKHRRQREGYSEDLDATMRVMKPISEFIDTESPIEMLSESNGFTFDTEADKSIEATMPDVIRESCDDLKLLGKSEFKSLIQWREKLKKMRKEEEEDRDDEPTQKKPKRVLTEEEREEEIMEEIRAMKEKRIRKKKREKKKEREASAKLRRRKVMGMESNAQLEEEQEGIFSLDGVGSKVAHVGDVNLDNVPAEAIEYDDKSSESEREENNNSDSDDSEMGDELDAAYELFLSKTKNAEAKSGTRRAKRKKKEERRRLEEQVGDDAQQMAEGGEHQRYLEMLSKGGQANDSDDDSGSSSDDGFFDEPVHPGKKTTRKKSKGLIVDLEGEDADEVKARNFFADPIFGDDDRDSDSDGNGDERGGDMMDEGDSGDSASSDEETRKPRKKQKKTNNPSSDSEDSSSSSGPITADDILASMPKTDKQKRHEKRIAASERLERRDARRAKQKGEEKLEIVDQEDDDLKELDEKTRARVSEARRLIKAGMGGDAKDDKGGLEIAPKIAVIDDRTYGSDQEDYDSDDHARTLALGTMMLRKSKAKQLVDASYNRFSWNDPKDLPDWFQDDESRHYRPQLPLPPALVQKMKDRFMTMAAKPIAKVAEARARKSKRANLALKAAKKKAEAVAQSSEMSETQKLKAITKAMKGKGNEGSGKTYVVAQKGKSKQGGKGIKLVDKRLKSDKRGMDRKGKKKKGGLTGGKRMRHHS